jgi:GNAT superfamily N-acetyltransferase
MCRARLAIGGVRLNCISDNSSLGGEDIVERISSLSNPAFVGTTILPRLDTIPRGDWAAMRWTRPACGRIMRMTAAAIILRLGRSQDARAVAIMSRDQIEFGLGWKYHPEHVCRLIRAPDTVTLVASDRGRVAGFAIMEFGDEHWHLVLLAVRPEYQSQGIGRRMMDWLLESCATPQVSPWSISNCARATRLRVPSTGQWVSAKLALCRATIAAANRRYAWFGLCAQPGFSASTGNHPLSAHDRTA